MEFEPKYTVVVRLERGVAPRVHERHGDWMELTDNADGSVTARFGASTLEWATGWVLGHGAAAKVLEPRELIVRVQVAAQGALRRYAEDGVVST